MEILRTTVTSSLIFLGVLALVAASAMGEPSRKGTLRLHEKCDKSAIQINQSPTAPVPNGIPAYIVEIVNTCLRGCNISNIHVKCDWFSSAHLVNPKYFKRLRYDDCLVNDGKPLRNGGVISFQYATTYPYPLSVSSVVCGKHSI